MTGVKLDVQQLAPFEWQRLFELGHEEIDKQHKRLFLLGKAVIVPPTGMGEHTSSAERLLQLTDFAKTHFAFEESLMKATAYPDAHRHVNMHSSLLADLSRYCASVHWNWGWDDIPEELFDFLWSWLAQHIDSSDRDMVAWINSHGQIDPVPAP